MSQADIIILIPLLYGAYRGYRRGLLLTVVTLTAFVVALLGAVKLLDESVILIMEFWEKAGKWLPIAAFIITFLIILLLVHWIGKLLKKALDLTLLGSVDNLAGALLGVLKWALLTSVLLWILKMVGVELPYENDENAILFPLISQLAPSLVFLIARFLPNLSEWTDWIGVITD